MKHAYVPRTTNYTLNPGDDLNDLRMSDQVRPLYDHVRKFIRETVEPMSVEFYRLGEKKTPIEVGGGRCHRRRERDRDIPLVGRTRIRTKRADIRDVCPGCVEVRVR